jgi:diguanylate cyclase (GGDEF)-like protein
VTDGNDSGSGSSPSDLARELFAVAAQKLAEDFSSVTATAVDALRERGPAAGGGAEDPKPRPNLRGNGEVRRRLDQLIEAHRRYEHPFSLVVFDVEGPGARNGAGSEGRETALVVAGAALHDSVRIVDDTYRLEGNGLCVLAPNQSTVGGVQMAERLLRMLDELEAAGGLSISISAGVVACPDHGEDPEALLRKADEAMWRARAVGQPVGVGALQDR